MTFLLNLLFDLLGQLAIFLGQFQAITLSIAILAENFTGSSLTMPQLLANTVYCFSARGRG
ncbi:MAG: hypothetical protein KAJ07_06760 [Planctomycetes bacterium]|nr:hypothetical protein [Planctomycetota bacterium]